MLSLVVQLFGVYWCIRAHEGLLKDICQDTYWTILSKKVNQPMKHETRWWLSGNEVSIVFSLVAMVKLRLYFLWLQWFWLYFLWLQRLNLRHNAPNLVLCKVLNSFMDNFLILLSVLEEKEMKIRKIWHVMAF